MNGADCEDAVRERASGPVFIYSMTSLLAEDARRAGLAGVAASLESALAALLQEMPEAQRKAALMLACSLTEASVPPARPPRLRLVSSRV